MRYHVMYDDETGDVMILLRFTTTGPTIGESYRPGVGWVVDNRAFDIMLNGQDYEIVDESTAEELVAELEAELTSGG